jgi:fido (protein-threonine AMPylation protein)
MNLKSIDVKKQELDQLRPLPPEAVRSLEAWFRVELTYTSNALEGSTLSRRETAVVLEKGLTVGGKTLQEHLEATNHARAIDFVATLVESQRVVSEDQILRLHELVLEGIDDANAGRYRDVAVRIAGSTVVLPNPRRIPELMREFAGWLGSRPELHPVAFAAEAHFKLVSIHPFVDGNGRTARLLMNCLLMMRGYPPAIIRPRDRTAYLGALETAQLGGPRTAYDSLVIHAVDRSLDIYLDAAGSRSRQGRDGLVAPGGPLLKIGQLARAVGETVPTIRHWMKLGLVAPAQLTPAGYQLFSAAAVERCRGIQVLKGRRLTLAEIGAALDEQDPQAGAQQGGRGGRMP